MGFLKPLEPEDKFCNKRKSAGARSRKTDDDDDDEFIVME
jgi:hypothetical protein